MAVESRGQSPTCPHASRRPSQNPKGEGCGSELSEEDRRLFEKEFADVAPLRKGSDRVLPEGSEHGAEGGRRRREARIARWRRADCRPSRWRHHGREPWRFPRNLARARAGRYSRRKHVRPARPWRRGGPAPHPAIRSRLGNRGQSGGAGHLRSRAALGSAAGPCFAMSPLGAVWPPDTRTRSGLLYRLARARRRRSAGHPASTPDQDRLISWCDSCRLFDPHEGRFWLWRRIRRTTRRNSIVN